MYRQKTILITEFEANPTTAPKVEPLYTLDLTRQEPRICSAGYEESLSDVREKEVAPHIHTAD